MIINILLFFVVVFVIGPILVAMAGWNLSQWRREHGEEFDEAKEDLKDALIDSFHLEEILEWLDKRIGGKK